MHFEILVEDQSGKKALDILVPKIIGHDGTHTFKIRSYKGVGRIPKNMKDTKNAGNRVLLDSLPKLLKGFGRTFEDWKKINYPAVFIVVCDLDDKCLKAFKSELLGILDGCNPKPDGRFCIAIEEGEAWFLGDPDAIRAAYPRADAAVLKSYKNDSICGTWEKLADAVYPGGVSALSKKGWISVGTEKSKWAETISPHMDIHNNNSPSFRYFRDKLVELAGLS